MANVSDVRTALGYFAWVLVFGTASSVASCGSDCDLDCPAGTTLDSIACSCVQAGPVCDGGASPEMQDGGLLPGDCCPANVLQSTSRAAPSGPCTGALSCFVAVHQICSGVSSGETGPIDQYQCTCDSTNWQCSLTLSGTGTCPLTEAGPSH